MFERFSENARKVMSAANQESTRQNAETIDVDHILIALVMATDCTAGLCFEKRVVHLGDIQRELNLHKKIDANPNLWQRLKSAIGIREDEPDQKGREAEGYQGTLPKKLPMSLMAKKAIENAIDESHNLGLNFVGTEHLLFGLLHSPESIAGKVLGSLGITLDETRREIAVVRLADEPTD